MSSKRIEILAKKTVFNKYFHIYELAFRHELYSGEMSEILRRFVIDRGDAVSALVHKVDTDTIFFTEQFRAPTYENGEGWLLEIPAGISERGEDTSAAIIREIGEEVGYLPKYVHLIGSFYLSPGGSTERVFLYYCTVTELDQVGKGGGLIEEGEDIKLIELKIRDAFEYLDRGIFSDAKTIIGLQWLRLNNAGLPKG